ncbi:uncharacterized protein TNCV_2891481 [Trichonephila clavipes]|nr:uncharacterized protein TNCV_2891481 [Trichonephila clavipes]
MGATLNRRRVASPLVRLVEEEEQWETADHLQGAHLQNWGGTELNLTIPLMVLKALDRFNVHRCPTRWVFSGTGLEPVTKQATVRYLYHSATTATTLSQHTWRYVNERLWYPSGQGIGSWLACHEFEPSTTKDPPCRGEMHVKSAKSSNVLPLAWSLRDGSQLGSPPRHLTMVQNDEVSRQKPSCS